MRPSTAPRTRTTGAAGGATDAAVLGGGAFSVADEDEATEGVEVLVATEAPETVELLVATEAVPAPGPAEQPSAKSEDPSQSAVRDAATGCMPPR